MEGIKSGRIEEIWFSLVFVWLEGWKSGDIENLFVWLRRKIKGWKSEIDIYVLVK